MSAFGGKADIVRGVIIPSKFHCKFARAVSPSCGRDALTDGVPDIHLEKSRRYADRQPREAIAPALAGYFLRGTQRVAARRAAYQDAPD